ncbi:MAG: hypothetical protein FJ343_06475 [Sphingomonadales bacterium]|nr:hypothetical protein [Sphingomonadales bacterium]
MTGSRSNPYWYTAGLFLLVYVLINFPMLGWWLVGALLVGLMPIRHPRWWKYGLLSLLALTISVLWNGISSTTVNTVGAITNLSGPVYVASVVLVDTLSLILVATTVQWWVGRWLLAKQYGYKSRG